MGLNATLQTDPENADLAEQLHDLRGALFSATIAVARVERTHDRAELSRVRHALAAALRIVDSRHANRTFSLARALRDAAREVEPLAAERAIAIDSHAAAVRVAGDEDELRRAFANLIRNAVQASPDGGRVTVTLARDALFARVLVEDQGPGVPAALRERVFDRYFTLRARGTGLGLAMVRRVVDEHRGAVRFLDGPGGRVEVLLPASALPLRPRA